LVRAGEEQERIVALILDEMASDRRREESFKRSEDVLAQLADETLEAAGLTVVSKPFPRGSLG
jgi:hypothetical protein